MDNRIRQAIAVALPVAVAAAAGWPADAAAELQVYVLTPDGRPAPDVVVAVLPRGPAPPAPVAAPVQIVQQDIRFQPYVTAVPLGTTVRFVNRDRFDHHVRSVPGGPLASIAPAKDFDFRLAAARGGAETSADVTMDAAGATGIGCHLHGSMRAHIYVSPTPWAAVTDAAGRAVLSGMPDGATELRLWHPDQLLAQSDLRTVVSGSAGTAQAKLNFTPRRRPPPRDKGEYEYR